MSDVVRYVIRNEKGEFWKRAAGGWSDEVRDARLYGEAEARAQCREIHLWERRRDRRLVLVRVTTAPAGDAAPALAGRSRLTDLSSFPGHG